MVFKIIWSSLAIRSYEQNVNYLKHNWSGKELNNFISLVESKINFISEFPEAGFSSSRNKHIRKTLIGKRIILIYRYRPRKKIIELVCFFNSWQNPKKI